MGPGILTRYSKQVLGSLLTLFVLVAAVLLYLTRWCKPTKKLHPILFILASAIVGILLKF